MVRNKFSIAGLCIFILLFIVSMISVSADSTTSDIYISAYVGTTTVKSISCTDWPSDQNCILSEITQQNCCSMQGGCNGGIAGNYYVKSEVTYDDGTGIQINYDGPIFMFECLDEGELCNNDASCITQHCVKGNVNGDKFCRTSDPYCNDQYCDDSHSETCLYSQGYTRDNAPNLPYDPVCGYYECDGNYFPQTLPAGYYPTIIEGNEVPYPYGQWGCGQNDSEGQHCDGEGYGSTNCISNCWDSDGDGYGIKPLQNQIAPTDDPNLYEYDSCNATSGQPDCNDQDITSTGGDGYFIHSDDSYLSTPSPYCDCDFETANGFTQGTNEGPVNLNIPISQDLCFDGIDNDCDGPADISDPNHQIDCSDPGCRAGDDYVYPIVSRICGDNQDGFKDCADTYDDENEYDRQCCPSASDCVVDGECVGSAELHGTFPEVHACSQGEWYGGDTYSTVCNWVVNDQVYPTANYTHWGLNGNAGGGNCCGDDSNEYYTEGTDGTFACCNTGNMYVLAETCLGSLTERNTWDGDNIGYCLDDSDCLVNSQETSFNGTVEDATDIYNPNGNAVRCIAEEEYIGDHYCNYGEWTSRTALIATQLIGFGGDFDDVSLYCGSYDEVLNHYDYSVNGGYAEYYLGLQSYSCMLGNNTVPCVNNVCVLKYNQGGQDKVVLGMSLNHDVDSSVYSILESLGGSNQDCNGQLNSDRFLSCGTGVWYNDKIKTVIFSPESITMGNVLVGSWNSALKSIYTGIFNSVAYRNPSTYDYGFVTGTQDFKNLYLAKKDNREILVIMEEIGNQKYMTASYEGFSSDICTLVNDYKTQNSKLIPLDCFNEGSTYRVVTGGLSSGYYDLFDDLGPNLRLE